MTCKTCPNTPVGRVSDEVFCRVATEYLYSRLCEFGPKVAVVDSLLRDSVFWKGSMSKYQEAEGCERLACVSKMLRTAAAALEASGDVRVAELALDFRQLEQELEARWAGSADKLWRRECRRCRGRTDKPEGGQP